jgi:hypothetical protein
MIRLRDYWQSNELLLDGPKSQSCAICLLKYWQSLSHLKNVQTEEDRLEERTLQNFVN